MLADCFITTAPLVAALATDATVMVPCPPLCLGGKWALREVGEVANATSATNGTNYSILTFTGSDGSTSLGTLTTASVSFTLGTRRAVSLTQSSNTVWTASTLTNAGVKVVKTHAASGIAVDVMLYAAWEKIREA